MRWSHAVIALLALMGGVGGAACQDNRVAPLPAVIVSPRELRFPDTFVGATSRLTLDLHSDATAKLPVTLATGGPFSVGQSALSVPNGDTTVTVSFRPTEAGHFAVDLVATDLSGATRVRLVGQGLADEDCSSVDTCTGRAFDPVAGRCVDHPMADGMGCSNACVIAGRCLEGVCRGAEMSCDDANPCTHDACDAEEGCVHSDGTGFVCPVPSDPCQVATCDPVAGCGIAPAPDGTDCDASDCDVTFTCQSGVCASKPTPEGATCPATPCQDEGVCHNHQCVRAPARTLEPEWTRPAEANHGVRFTGVADDDGNLYYSECTREESPDVVCDIVSLDYRGRLRWRDRAQSVGQCNDSQTERMMLLDNLLISAESENVIEARNPQDGSIVWRLDALDAVTNGRLAVWMLDKHYFGVDASPIVDVGDGTLLAFVTAYSSCGPYVTAITSGNWLMGIDAATGTVKWLQPFDREQYPYLRILADEDGRAFFLADQLTRDPSTGQYSTWSTLKGIDGRTGRPLWALDSALMPLAVAGGHLLVADRGASVGANVYLLDPSTGDVAAPLLAGSRGVSYGGAFWPLLDSTSVFIWGAQCTDSSCQTVVDPDTDGILIGALPSAKIIGRPVFHRGSSGEAEYSGGVLMTNGALLDVLSSAQNSGSTRSVVELSRDGRQLFRCPHGDPGIDWSQPTLWSGHWVGSCAGYDRTVSFDLGPTAGRPASGWSTTGGDGKGRNRPR